jgi:hypothetical protein
MKSLAAILFFTLISLSMFSSLPLSWKKGYEVVADSEEKALESKEEKKEAKEFTLQHLKKQSGTPSVRCLYGVHEAFTFPQPVLDKHTPPPDPTC